MTRLHWICLCLLLGAVACDDDVEESDDDATDTAQDPGSDLGADSGLPDLIVDAGEDLGEDGGEDAGGDGGEDADVDEDGGEDTGGDGGEDTGGDEDVDEDVDEDARIPEDLGFDAGATLCGGPRDLGCGELEYCDYADDRCGDDDAWGVCRPRPEGCGGDYSPVCGCDGAVHPNACSAAGAGADLDISGGCTPPEGAFACGPRFCDLDLQYCTVTHPGVCCSPPSYHCADLPEACGVTPSCDCVDDDDDFGDSCDCAGDGASGLRVSCYLP
jgi:hypothetical protein